MWLYVPVSVYASSWVCWLNNLSVFWQSCHTLRISLGGSCDENSWLRLHAWFLYLTPATMTCVLHGWLDLWREIVWEQVWRVVQPVKKKEKKFSRWHEAQWCSNEFCCHLSVIKLSCLETALTWQTTIGHSVKQRLSNKRFWLLRVFCCCCCFFSHLIFTESLNIQLYYLYNSINL